MTDILMVEDSSDIAMLLCDFLRAKSYTVSEAGTGERALELLSATAQSLSFLTPSGGAATAKARAAAVWGFISAGN